MLQTSASDPPKTNDLFQLDDHEAAIDLKGSVFTLPVLCIKTSKLPKIDNDLKERLSKSPQFFLDAAIVIDLGSIKEYSDEFDFAKFANLLRRHQLVPVGVQHGNEVQHNAAKLAGFAILKGGVTQELQTTSREKNTAATTKISTQQQTTAAPVDNTSLENKASTDAIKSLESTPLGLATKVIDQPVRSGQRIYHQGGDLVLLAAVNAGAEIMADGNIHVYAPLRGRALAGVRGNGNAHIFCQHMEAELIAIAGQYRVFELKVPPEMLGKALQISLQGEKLIISPLA